MSENDWMTNPNHWRNRYMPAACLAILLGAFAMAGLVVLTVISLLTQ